MDPSQYYNPIIQAMVHTATLKKQGEQQEIEKKRNEQEAKAREQQLAQSQEQIENAHEMQLKQHDLGLRTLELQKHQADIEAEMHKINALKTLSEVGKTANPEFMKQIPILSSVLGGQPQQQTQRPDLPPEMSYGDQQTQVQPQQQQPQIDFSGIYDPKKVAESEAAIAGARAKAEAEGRLLSEQKLIDYKTAAEQKIQQGKFDFEKVENALDRKNRLQITAMTNAAHLQAVGMDTASRPEMTKSLVLGGLTGEIKLDPKNPIERAAYNVIEQNGGHLVDPKEILALRESQKLIPLFDKLEAFAKKAPTDKVGAFIQGLGAKGAAAVGFPTDLQNQLNIINSQAMVVGKSVEGMTGRPLATQLKLDLDSLASPGITKDQMIERINNIRENYVNNQNNMVFGGMPEFQKEIIKKKYGVTPVESKSPQSQKSYERTAVGAGGHRIGLSGGKWYDVQTGAEVK